ncbi:MAG: YqgE/AlgH family protein [Bacteroidota bacterium]
MTNIKQEPNRGTYLLAEPFLADTNFRRTVVLLTEHNDQGTVGYVLNRPSELKLHEAIPDFPDFAAVLYEGGPVERRTLHYIHRIEELGEDENEIAPGVYWGGDYERLKLMIMSGHVDPDDIRFFHGYSGWGPDQLDGEMETNSWIVAPSRPTFTFAQDTDDLWANILKAMGGKYRLMANYPPHPSLN